MKRLVGFTLLAVMGMGCTAHMMETHGDNIQVMSLGQGNIGRGGVIRYLHTGFDSWKKARRKNAENQMATYCAGPYKITAEGPRSKFGASMPIGPHSSVEFDEYTYLAFDCEK